MLAEKRRKTHYVLQPKGKPLFNDLNNYGTKMLKKMGWCEGKGLGKSEQGNQEIIRVSYKNDIKGLGYSDKNNQWEEHEDQFNTLLHSLNNSETNLVNVDTSSSCTKKDISGISLEEKSKNSKARVHYKKFTRGKDLSQYSEKDLANIFGKKSLDVKICQVSNEVKVDENTKISNFGIMTHISNFSLPDYFKQKNIKTQKEAEDSATKCEPKKNKQQFEHVLLNENPEKIKKRKGFKIEDESFVQNVTPKKLKKLKDEINVAEITIKETAKNVKTEIEKEFVGEIRKSYIGEDYQNVKVDKQSRKPKKNKIIKGEGTSEGGYKKPKSNETTNLSMKHNLEGGEEILDNKVTKSNLIKNENQDDNRQKTNEKDNSNLEMVQSNRNTKLEKKNNIKCSQNKDNINEICSNKIQITQYSAEKFRNTNLNAFIGSNLNEIYGYGLEKDFEVSVIEAPKDMELIMKFWNLNSVDSTLNEKYVDDDVTKSKNYKKKVDKARKLKRKLPNFNVKSLKKKSIFKKVKI